MTTTDDLVHSLAAAAGTRPGTSLQEALAIAGAASLACAVLLMLSVFGVRQDFPTMAVHLPFAFKLVYSGALVIGALVVARNAAIPGASATALCALSPAAVVLAWGITCDPTGYPIAGRTDTAVVACVARILVLSIPAMILTFGFMRKGAPTQPVFAGAVIGLLSASIGALAYTVACRNDGTAFVAIWYAAACAIMATIGAVVGRRVLRW